MNNKKAVVDKVFVYVFSVIIIGFAGFMVTSFVLNFSDDTDLRLQTEFYEKLEKDYTLIYRSYGSEKVLKYKVHPDVNYVCFVPNAQCLNNIEYISSDIENYDTSTLIDLINAGDNVVMYDNIDFMNSYKIGSYTSNNECFCVKPVLGRFDLIIENVKNNVYIDVIEE